MTFRPFIAGAAALAATCLVPFAGGRAALGADSIDKGFTASGNVEIVGRFADAQPSGIALLPDGRLILGFPRGAHDHAGPRLAVFAGGNLTPFPDAGAQSRFVSPLGMTVDAQGHLWVLDEGMIAGKTVSGGQKLVEIDPKTNAVVSVHPVSATVLRPDSHVNDVRIDLTHGVRGTAFITDSSVATHPALLVIDLATNAQRRILADTRFVVPETGFVAMMDGEVHRYDPEHPTMPQGGANGIALSPDQKTLYWQPQTSRRLYSAPTSVLADQTAPESSIEAAVQDLGETGMGDGMATAPDGTLYITDDERHGILARKPGGAISLIARDPRMVEPDGLTYGPGVLYSTIGQWARLPDFHGGKDAEERPWVVVKVTLPKN